MKGKQNCDRNSKAYERIGRRNRKGKITAKQWQINGKIGA
jgi:hypothetical protein